METDENTVKKNKAKEVRPSGRKRLFQSIALMIGIMLILCVVIVAIGFGALKASGYTESMWNQVHISGADFAKIFRVMIFRILRISVITGAVIFVYKVSDIVGERVLHFFEDENPDEQSEKEARAKTLIDVIRNSVRIFAILIGIMSVLAELGINIAPLLTGAGIVGIAIGFGAQSLVKDFFTGMFILMENQYSVGDVIKVGEYAGLVEKITVRVTSLRDLSGTLHMIPNGNISIVSNMTKHWSRTVLDIKVSYESDMDTALDVLREISREIYAAPEWRIMLNEEPVVLGVDKLDDNGYICKIIVSTKPIKQWDVMRELNYRIKHAFDDKGIRLALPVVRITDGDRPRVVS